MILLNKNSFRKRQWRKSSMCVWNGNLKDVAVDCVYFGIEESSLKNVSKQKPQNEDKKRQIINTIRPCRSSSSHRKIGHFIYELQFNTQIGPQSLLLARFVVGRVSISKSLIKILFIFFCQIFCCSEWVDQSTTTTTFARWLGIVCRENGSSKIAYTRTRDKIIQNLKKKREEEINTTPSTRRPSFVSLNLLFEIETFHLYAIRGSQRQSNQFRMQTNRSCVCESVCASVLWRHTFDVCLSKKQQKLME